jgi:toxin-antitoxin system PIN domain toxin
MPRYLLDVNAFIALIDENHIHHQPVTKWFNTPDLEWAICPFTEAGFLRHATRASTGNMSMSEATEILEDLAAHPGYHYQPFSHDWHTLTKPFFKRLQGHNQVTDAYLLGLAVRQGLVLATFDKRILHLAGEHSKHVYLLGSTN